MFIDFKLDDGWKVVEAIGAASAAAIALWQVLSIRKESRKSATLTACERYDTDPVLDRYIRQLSRYRDEAAKTPEKYRLAISTILNYLDGIAIGVAQGLYIDKLAKDHLEDFVKEYVPDDLMDGATARALTIKQSDYRHLLALYARWTKPKTAYGPLWKWS